MEAILRPGVICALAGLLCGGCSGLSPLPTLPDISDALSLNQGAVVGSPTEVYSRVARGAMTCWFGTTGPLKASYVYHAEALPAAQGGKAQIVIHERDRLSEDPRGLRAFRVQIAPNGDTARVAVENLKLEAQLASSMEKDVHRWAGGAIGCTEEEAGAWAPQGATAAP